MANFGNTGQRYRMSRVMYIEQKGQQVYVCLDCGHNYFTEPMWVTVETLVEQIKQRIGKRERCNLCEVTV